MFEEKESFWQKKGFYFSACILLVGVMAVGAICVRQANNQNGNKLMANIATEVPQPTANSTSAATSKKEEAAAANANVSKNQINKKDDTAAKTGTATDSNDAKVSKDTGKTSSDTEASTSSDKKSSKNTQTKSQKSKETSAAVKNKLSFNEESGLLWPIEGDVILKYSMTNTVYFKTLAQYKCNPGIAIAAKEGAEVKAASDCKVTKVSKDDELGTIVTTDIGDKYTVTYGQMANLKVKKGDTLAEGDIIGTVAKPTKYYTEEGTNLYLQVNDGKSTVDPLFLLR